MDGFGMEFKEGQHFWIYFKNETPAEKWENAFLYSKVYLKCNLKKFINLN